MNRKGYRRKTHFAYFSRPFMDEIGIKTKSLNGHIRRSQAEKWARKVTE